MDTRYRFYGDYIRNTMDNKIVELKWWMHNDAIERANYLTCKHNRIHKVEWVDRPNKRWKLARGWAVIDTGENWY